MTKGGSAGGWHNKPSTYDGFAICERLEAIVEELRILRMEVRHPNVVHITNADFNQPIEPDRPTGGIGITLPPTPRGNK